MNSTVNVDGQSHIYELNPKIQIFINYIQKKRID